MSGFGGGASVEIHAPPAACFQTVADTLRTPEWHKSIEAVQILQRDPDGRTSLVAATIDAQLVRVLVNLRVSYEPDRVVHMQRESGDLKDLLAIWTFEELNGGRTLARFETEFDPGRGLSLLARGPVLARLQALLAHQPAEGLKRAVENGERA